MRRLIITLITLAVVATPGLLLFSLMGGSSESILAVEPLPVSVLSVERSDHYRVERSYLGQVEAKQTSSLAFEYPGQLRVIPIEEGDKVQEGQLLAELDVEEVLARKDEALARLAAAQAQRELSASTLRRSMEAGSAVSEQALEEARLNDAASQADVEALQASLAAINVRLKKSLLIAPYSGTIVRRYVDEGATVEQGRAVFDIQSDSLPKLRVGLPGQLARDVQVGQIVTIRLNGEQLEALVTAALPLRDALTRTVDLLLQSPVDADAGDLVELLWQRERSVPGFWVPLSALTQSVRGLWTAYSPAFVEEETYRLEARLVEIIYSDDERAFVRGNLEHGDLLVSDGLLRVVPGQLVRLEEG